jgi:hypothetical protein
MGDDQDVGGGPGGQSKDKSGVAGGGGIDEDDFDEKNLFALLMN